MLLTRSSEALFGQGEAISATHPSWREAPPVHRMRGHVLVGLQEALRARGHYPRYRELAERDGLSAILDVSAGEWLDIERVVESDRVLAALELEEWELSDVGAEVTKRTYGAVLSTLMRLSTHVGVDAATLLQQFPRLYPRLLDGGGCGVFRISPRVVRYEMWNHPLARSPVNRIVTRGSLLATFQKLNPATTISEAGVSQSPPSFALRIQY
jgi:hypothetical protein